MYMYFNLTSCDLRLTFGRTPLRSLFLVYVSQHRWLNVIGQKKAPPPKKKTYGTDPDLDADPDPLVPCYSYLPFQSAAESQCASFR